MTIMGTTPFTIRLDEELKRRLEEEAGKEDRSASSLAVRAIRRMLEERVAKRRFIEAALAEADRGEFISEEVIAAWFTSLGGEEELPEPEPDVIKCQRRLKIDPPGRLKIDPPLR